MSGEVQRIGAEMVKGVVRSEDVQAMFEDIASLRNLIAETKSMIVNVADLMLNENGIFQQLAAEVTAIKSSVPNLETIDLKVVNPGYSTLHQDVQQLKATVINLNSADLTVNPLVQQMLDQIHAMNGRISKLEYPTTG